MNLFLKILLISIGISPVLISQDHKRSAEALVSSVNKKQKVEEGAKYIVNSEKTEEAKDLDAVQKCALIRKFKIAQPNYLSAVTNNIQDLQDIIAQYAAYSI